MASATPEMKADTKSDLKPTKVPAKRKFSGIETVTLFVGPEKAKFVVHQELLTDTSSFFRAGFTGAFRETNEKKMDLPDDKPDILETFIDWLYKERLSRPASLEYVDADLELYFLAEKYDVPMLKTALINQFWELKDSTSEVWIWARIQSTYQNTGASSGLRRLIVNRWSQVSWHSPEPDKGESWIKRFESLPAFAASLVMEVMVYGRDRGVVDRCIAIHEERKGRASVASDFYDL